jgi:Ras-related GTP-binding protein A/B
MDLISQDQRNFLFTQKSRLITSVSDPIQPIIFATSIWDETLYQAWSSIVYSLIPNVQSIEANLQKLCKICEAAEVVMFEKATFLVISHAKQEDHDDIHRFEKLSNIIKQFKLSCSKSQTQFTTMEIRTKTMTIFIRPMTSNTYILLMLSDTSIQSAIPIMNLDAARSHFEALEMGK